MTTRPSLLLLTWGALALAPLPALAQSTPPPTLLRLEAELETPAAQRVSLASLRAELDSRLRRESRLDALRVELDGSADPHAAILARLAAELESRQRHEARLGSLIVELEPPATNGDVQPPTLSCPADLSVIAAGPQGLFADDPRLAAFFAGASASDDQDPAPRLRVIAPPRFPLGVTQVRFVAEDAAGNSRACERRVTVLPPPTRYDLALDELRVLSGPTGAPVRAELTMTNRGDAVAPVTTLSWSLSELPLAQASIPALAPGERLPLALDLSPPSRPSLLVAAIDPTGRPADADPGNDRRALLVGGGPADLALRVTLEPAGPYAPGQRFLLRGQVTSPDGVAIPGARIQVELDADLPEAGESDAQGEARVWLTAPLAPGEALLHVEARLGAAAASERLRVTVLPGSGRNLATRNADLELLRDPAASGPLCTGDDVTLALRLRNVGDEDVLEPFRVRFFADGQAIGERLLDCLGAGQEAVVRLPHTLARAGRVAFRAIVDAGERVRESQELDNHAERVVEVLGNVPNLRALDLRVDDPTPVTGAPFVLSATVDLQGKQPLTSVRLRFARDGEPLGTATLAGLAPGSPRTVSLRTRLTAPGPHVLSVVLDPEDGVAEADESDNRRALTIDVHAPAPDLAIAVFRVDPPRVVFGETQTADLRLRNQGELPAPASLLEFRLGTLIVGQFPVPPLAPGAEHGLQVPFVKPAGTHLLEVRADALGQVTESLESNNVAIARFTVDAQPLPDLRARLAAAARVVAPGDALAITRELSNQGSAPAGAVGWELRAGAAPIDSGSAAGIVAGGADVGASSVTPGEVGLLELSLRADPVGRIAESDETNNRDRVLVAVGSPPDLSVEALVVSNPNPAAGEELIVQVILRNLGPVEAFAIAVQLERAGVPGESLAGLRIPAGGSRQVELRTRALAAGPLSLAVRVDPADRIPESDETNNRAELTVQVEAANEAPTAQAGADQSLALCPGASASVTLDGSGSSDPEGDPLGYLWTGPFGQIGGASPTVSLPLGTHLVQLVVSDGRLESAPSQVRIVISELAPPSVRIASPPPPVVYLDLDPERSQLPLELRVEDGGPVAWSLDQQAFAPPARWRVLPALEREPQPLPADRAATLPSLPGHAAYLLSAHPAAELERFADGSSLLRAGLFPKQGPFASYFLELRLRTAPLPAQPRQDLGAGSYAPVGPVDPSLWTAYQVEPGSSLVRLDAPAAPLSISPAAEALLQGRGANQRNQREGLGGRILHGGTLAGEADLSVELEALPPALTPEVFARLGLPLLGRHVLEARRSDSCGRVAVDSASFELVLRAKWGLLWLDPASLDQDELVVVSVLPWTPTSPPGLSIADVDPATLRLRAEASGREAAPSFTVFENGLRVSLYPRSALEDAAGELGTRFRLEGRFHGPSGPAFTATTELVE